MSSIAGFSVVSKGDGSSEVVGRSAVEQHRTAAQRAEDPPAQTELSAEMLSAAFGPLSLAAVPHLEAVYNRLVEKHSVKVGKRASAVDRDRIKGDVPITLVYGEINFISYALTVEKIKNVYGGFDSEQMRTEGIFYDLGSGVGKAVFASALLLENFKALRGIEILPSLHDVALELKEKWDAEIVPILPANRVGTAIELIKGDILKEDWSDGNLIFINSTCFDDELMEKIAEKAEDLAPGTLVITFTKALPSSSFEILEHETHMQSWGHATVYIMRRLVQ